MSKKIQDFVKRNRTRNAHLYSDRSLVQGEDYIVCPHTAERLTMIKSSYIEKVLEMTVEEFDRLYPNTVKAAPSRSKKFLKTVTAVDPTTGKTIKELAVEKSVTARTTVGEDGLTPAQRAGARSAKTRTEAILESGLTVAQAAAAKAIIKGNQTKAEKGMINASTTDRELYYRLVKYLLTNKYSRSGVELNVKIVDGYNNKVSPLLMVDESNVSNLDDLGNVSHSYKSAFSADSLVNSCNYTVETSTAEFNMAMDLLRECVQEYGQLSCGIIIEKLNNAEVRKKYGL